jgi:nitroreductase
VLQHLTDRAGRASAAPAGGSAVTDRTYRPVPFRVPRLTSDEMRDGLDRFARMMRRRRTIRMFSDEPVDSALIDDAIRVAATAPSGADQQPWTFVVVTDPEVRRRIRQQAEAEERRFYESDAAEWHAALAHLGTDWHKEHLTRAPYLIVVFAQRYGLRTDPATGGTVKVKHYYVQESVGIAVGFLLAALTHAGLATLTHTPSPMGFLGRILGRPANESAYVVIAVGHPAPDCVVPTLRKKPLEEVLVRV